MHLQTIWFSHCAALPLFISISRIIKRQVSVSLSVSVCSTGSWILLLISLSLFVWPANPGQLQMLFGAIINLRDGSRTDPFSNILEMSLLLGLPYIRLSHYFKWSPLCILHLHMHSNETELVQRKAEHISICSKADFFFHQQHWL